MNDTNRLNDMLHAEMMNQSMYKLKLLICLVIL